MSEGSRVVTTCCGLFGGGSGGTPCGTGHLDCANSGRGWCQQRDVVILEVSYEDALAQAEKIPLENVFVIVDDIALPFGTIRIRAKGSDGGHNGLKNIAELLGTNAYARLRFGIGGDFPKGMQIDYVLGEWTKEEATALPERTKVAAEAIKAFGTIGLERTMNQFNNS